MKKSFFFPLFLIKNQKYEGQHRPEKQKRAYENNSPKGTNQD